MSRPARLLLLLLALLALGVAACEELGIDPGADCATYQGGWQQALGAGAELRSTIPEAAESFPMALVLDQDALNSLFARVGDLELPELSESATVVGQTLTASVRPELPLLQIGGTRRCPDCIVANVPFDVGMALNRSTLPRGRGSLTVQLPIRLVADGLHSTDLVAEFQQVAVLGLDIAFQSEVANQVLDVAQPIITTLLTSYLRSEFEDARIASFRSWTLGAGDIALAARGPFVFSDAGTIVLAMQSNLPLGGSLQATAERAVLPEGADLAVVLDPALLGAVAQRMIYEDFIPQSYDELGSPTPGGGTKLTLASVQATDEELLRTEVALWRTNNFCGSARLAADLGLAFSPSGVSFALRDVSVLEGQGSGLLLAEADSLAGNFLDALVETLEIAVNYDEILGGEAAEPVEVETFRASIDGGGVQVFLDLL